MAFISVEIPKLTASNMTIETLAEFSRMSDFFLASHPSIAFYQLLDVDLQEEIELELSRAISEIPREEIVEFLQASVRPKGLRALAEQLRQMKCVAYEKGKSRLSLVRNYAARFQRVVTFAKGIILEEERSEELETALSPEQGEEIDKDDHDTDEEPEATEDTPIHTDRKARKFQKHCREIFVDGLRPTSFRDAVKFEQKLDKPKSLKKTYQLAMQCARRDDALREGGRSYGLIPDGDGTFTEKQEAKTRPTERDARPAIHPVRPAGKGPMKRARTLRFNCRHCGGGHFDNECPTRTNGSTPQLPGKEMRAPKAPPGQAARKEDRPRPTSVERTRPCRHCGGAHWDNECTKGPRGADTRYSRLSGSLRPQPKQVQVHDAKTAASVDGPMTAHAQIKGQIYSVIIDTGASLSFISKKLAQELGAPRSAKDKPRIRLASGETQTIEEEVDLEITFPWRIPVRTNWTFKILGLDDVILIGTVVFIAD